MARHEQIERVGPAEANPRRRLDNIESTTCPQASSRCWLTGFDAAHASSIAAWVRNDCELIWLAPGTPPPLTAEKVLAWGQERRNRYLLWHDGRAEPIGYAELNEMPDHADQMWIGHLLLDPAMRGRGVGLLFTQALLARAFLQLSCREVLLVVFPDNRAALRCYLHAGMTDLGRETKYFERVRRRHTLVRMGIQRGRFDGLVKSGRMMPTTLPLLAASASGELSVTS